MLYSEERHEIKKVIFFPDRIVLKKRKKNIIIERCEIFLKFR